MREQRLRSMKFYLYIPWLGCRRARLKSNLSGSKSSPFKGPSLQLPAWGSSFGCLNTSSSGRLTTFCKSPSSLSRSQAQKALASFALTACTSQASHSTDGEGPWWDPPAKDQVSPPTRDPASWSQRDSAHGPKLPPVASDLRLSCCGNVGVS